jgi:hypothetical protein
MCIVLEHSVLVESWNIAGWTTSILLHTKAAGKNKNKKKLVVNFSTNYFPILASACKI